MRIGNEIARRLPFAGILAACLAVLGARASITFTTLFAFDGTNGATPAALVQTEDGSLYGTALNTRIGGNLGPGRLFKLTTDGAFTNLPNGTLGSPNYLMRAFDGGFFGTDGGIFYMTPDGTSTNLHSFPVNGTDGYLPGVLVQNSNGDLYGIAQYSGPGLTGDGSVFRFGTNGEFQTIARFYGTNGSQPTCLLLGDDGSFYGTTMFGGDAGRGTVFRMSPDGTVQTLFSFGLTNGGAATWLLQGTDHCLYGTTYQGGLGHGSVFKMTTAGAPIWTFFFNGTNGDQPFFLMQASDGNFYGTASLGGVHDRGSIFKLTPDGELTSQFSFDGTNGIEPFFLLQQPDGNLYGTTFYGGAGGYGIVFQLSLPMAPAFQPITQTNNTLRLTWSSVARQTYQLQFNSDLNSTNWHDLGSPAVATNGTMSAVDSIGPDLQHFYRVVLLP